MVTPKVGQMKKLTNKSCRVCLSDEKNNRHPTWPNAQRSLGGHTVNSGSEMVEAKHVSGKNICCVKMLEKHVETRKNFFVHCPFL